MARNDKQAMREMTSRSSLEPTLDGLFEREAAAVMGFFVVRCGNRAVAEDLTADTFVDAARHHASGRGDEVTPAWLRTVARRRLVDHWRRHSAHRRRFDRIATEVATGSGDVPADLELGSADGDRTTQALDSLPDRQRAALVLRYLEEFSVAEVAAALETSYKATESLLARARHSFRAAYKEAQ